MAHKPSHQSIKYYSRIAFNDEVEYPASDFDDGKIL